MNLGDDATPIVVDVDFREAATRLRKRQGARILPDFRPLDADGCAAERLVVRLIEPQNVGTQPLAACASKCRELDKVEGTFLLPGLGQRRRQLANGGRTRAGLLLIVAVVISSVGVATAPVVEPASGIIATPTPGHPGPAPFRVLAFPDRRLDARFLIDRFDDGTSAPSRTPSSRSSPD